VGLIQRIRNTVLRSSILWGVLASIVFFRVINSESLGNQFLQRYCAGHPVEYIETAFFFVGLAVLLLKLVDAAFQFRRVDEPRLGPPPRQKQPVEHAEVLLGHLRRNWPEGEGDAVVARLRGALEHIQRTRSTAGLDDELKYLSEQESNRNYSSYAFLRIIIWAIPILGFLGTVVGITEAIANLSPDALEKCMPDVIKGLGVAFDTTALALSLSMILMFVQYWIEKFEGRLAARTDDHVAQELSGRFEQTAAESSDKLDGSRDLAEVLAVIVEELIRRQAALWQQSMDAAHDHWAQKGESMGRQFQTAMTGALNDSLKTHAEHLSAAELAMAEQNRRHWQGMQQALNESTQAAVTLQASLQDQAAMLSRAVDAVGEVTRLEDALNRNLSALAGARNFEQTVISLAAAIHLLNARLNQPAEAPAVSLKPGKRTSQAA
jgi:hypothetical protein